VIGPSCKVVDVETMNREGCRRVSRLQVAQQVVKRPRVTREKKRYITSPRAICPEVLDAPVVSIAKVLEGIVIDAGYIDQEVAASEI